MICTAWVAVSCISIPARTLRLQGAAVSLYVDLEARPWDFQAEECALRACVEQFNSRHYSGSAQGDSQSVLDLMAGDVFDDELYQPSNFNVVSVLSEEIPLSEDFKNNYEEWLDQEVFGCPVDWDAVVRAE